MMRLKAYFMFYVVAAMVAGCAITGTALGPTPEHQILNGANAVTAATVLATSLLRVNKITVVQAKGYRAILGTASGHLDAANVTLLDCRKRTASTSVTSPDPCVATIAADINLAVSVVGEVQKTLKAKE